MAQGEDGFASRVVAQSTLELDAAVTCWRQASDEPSHLSSGTAAPLPMLPSRIEIEVLAALARTYGRAIFDDQRFLPVVDCVAECGAVVLVQCVL
ncbi:hypothetical protein AWB81_07035 [Caballeronia arationis]|uniref:hypothetical protein n=1 Tax=Caballeronia arationis TaxID=1777142 RepID=UPI00074C2866|nr:hypothetical protein [Caballeronia arationis]SAL05143.1 hypothetical protein AWB81_07035 [Caballeronia arationis]